MPTGLLLPAFALVLVANAILIAIAIRSMKRGGALDDAPFPTRSIPPIARSARPVPSGIRAPAPPAVAPVSPPAETPSAPNAPASTTRAMTERDADPEETPAARTAIPPDAGPPPEPRGPRPRPRKMPATTTSRSGGRRRRFLLPPLDEDHEKVSRSIATFLDPGSADDPDSATSESSTGSADDDSGQPPTTVALVAVSGHDDGDEPASPLGLAVAAIERALRGAARGTDRVDVLGTGRYRIVLASTGELAARAYLRRVRAISEPLLEELDPPRRLVVATATALGEPLGRAGDIAERRLGALLDAARADDEVRPRAVPD